MEYATDRKEITKTYRREQDTGWYKRSIYITPDSNIQFLPAFYFLPVELVAVSKECFEVPRCPMELTDDPEKWAALINSNVFLQLVMEGIAYLAWPHIGVVDPKEVFSMDDPLYRWVFGIPQHIKHLYEFGYDLNKIFKMKRGEHFRFLSMEEAHMYMDFLMKCSIHEQNMQPIIEFIKRNRCDEDFAGRQSKAKIDFMRKRYHAKDFADRVEASLDQANEKAQNDYRQTGIDIPDGSINVEEDAIGNVVVDEFKQTLTENDMNILELRMQGYTYEEIAKQMGYKNHSGIIKRIRRIADAWLDFVDDKSNIAN